MNKTKITSSIVGFEISNKILDRNGNRPNIIRIFNKVSASVVNINITYIIPIIELIRAEASQCRCFFYVKRIHHYISIKKASAWTPRP